MSKKNRPGFITNMVYGKGKILDKDMYMSDNDNKSVIVEDTLSRNKKHKEKCLKKVKVWREHHERTLPHTGKPGEKFPQMMIERYEMASELTLAEFKNLCATENEERWRLDEEYRKEHPMKPEIIEQLTDAFVELNKTYDYQILSSTIRFDMALNPIKYIGREAYDMNVYQDLITSFQEQYFEKWADDEMKKNYKEHGWWPYSTDDGV